MVNAYQISSEIKHQLEEIRLNEVRRFLKKNNIEDSTKLEICTQQFLERILHLALHQTTQQPEDRQEEILGQLAQIFNRSCKLEQLKNG